jgi:hypothetical protein
MASQMQMQAGDGKHEAAQPHRLAQSPRQQTTPGLAPLIKNKNKIIIIKKNNGAGWRQGQHRSQPAQSIGRVETKKTAETVFRWGVKFLEAQ